MGGLGGLGVQLVMQPSHRLTSVSILKNSHIVELEGHDIKLSQNQWNRARSMV